jgi:hypothetical protein
MRAAQAEEVKKIIQVRIAFLRRKGVRDDARVAAAVSEAAFAGGACIAGFRQLNGMPGHQRASEGVPAFFLRTYFIIRLRRLRNWSIPIVGSVKAAAQSRSDEIGFNTCSKHEPSLGDAENAGPISQ